MRVGVVDLGTNSTRLLVADVDGGHVREVARRTAITRLGESVDSRRRLLPLPVARVRNVLSDYRRELERLGAERVLAVGTSAVRDAENGEAFLGEIQWSYGFATRLVTGEEEAELTRRGVANGRGLENGTLVLDVGGGSTELITASGCASVDVGSVRLTDRHLHSDPPRPEELAAAAQDVRGALPDLDASDAVGVAGTITTLAALELGGYDRDEVHGHRLTREGVETQLERLASLPVAERRELPGLEPGRAPVIVGGAIVVREALERYGLDGLEASERDLLHGAALEAADLPEPEEGAAPAGAYTCC
ncbi:MAG TPA: Ppx/GppA phosphatase family protein [Gaiellaceae bacterium]|nr:Ppx/GppA phosphatase family protein [Gaiellaceae bacterium]